MVFAEQRLENKSPAPNSSGSRGTRGRDNAPPPRPEVPGVQLWAAAGRGLQGCGESRREGHFSPGLGDGAHSPATRPRRPGVLPAVAGSVCHQIAVCAAVRTRPWTSLLLPRRRSANQYLAMDGQMGDKQMHERRFSTRRGWATGGPGRPHLPARTVRNQPGLPEPTWPAHLSQVCFLGAGREGQGPQLRAARSAAGLYRTSDPGF